MALIVITVLSRPCRNRRFKLNLIRFQDPVIATQQTGASRVKGVVMQTLFQALPVILRKAGGDPQVEEQIAFAFWRKIAGDGLSSHSAPVAFTDQTLRVAVTDRTWKTQLEKLAPEYIARMARLSGTPLVTRLDFQIDPGTVSSHLTPTVSPLEFQNTEEITRDLQDAAATIRDEDLRRIFLEAAAHSIERSGG